MTPSTVGSTTAEGAVVIGRMPPTSARNDNGRKVAVAEKWLVPVETAVPAGKVISGQSPMQNLAVEEPERGRMHTDGLRA